MLNDKIKRIDVYFGATYQDGVFVRQSAKEVPHEVLSDWFESPSR